MRKIIHTINIRNSEFHLIPTIILYKNKSTCAKWVDLSFRFLTIDIDFTFIKQIKVRK